MSTVSALQFLLLGCCVFLACVKSASAAFESGQAFEAMQWHQLEGAAQQAIIHWSVEHDSRIDSNLGFEKSETLLNGTAWVSPNIARVDTYCMTAIGSDGKIHPQNRDPTFCRDQFRHILFHDRIERPVPIPKLAPISFLFEKPQSFPSTGLGALVQLSALAPVLAWNPAFGIADREFFILEQTAQDLGRQIPILRQSSAQLSRMELWIDPENGSRVQRLILYQDQQKTGQIDLEYNGANPAGWSVLEFASDGFVIDFLKVVVTNIETKERIENSAFELPNPSGKLRKPVRLAPSAFRDFIAFLRPYRWFAMISFCFALISVWKWKNSLPIRWISIVGVTFAIGFAASGFLPIGEITLREAHDEITCILQDERNESSSIQDLKYLARHMSQSYTLRKSNSLIATCFGQDIAREKATLELMKMAQYNIPNAMKIQSRDTAEWEIIRDRLAKVDLHLSSYLFSPYHRPVPLSQRIETK